MKVQDNMIMETRQLTAVAAAAFMANRAAITMPANVYILPAVATALLLPVANPARLVRIRAARSMASKAVRNRVLQVTTKAHLIKAG